MAERGSYAQGPRLDIQQLLVEAQHRWLRPAEICEILSNYHKFQISSEPPNRPPSGSLFLFDRKVLRYFRKDGHNWRKKKDGKTVKEAHEKLKVGSVDVLHCYYAHGEENETFQRRCYWMLEQDLMHIVFVHYLEVKGNRANVGREIDEVTTNLQKGSHWNSSPSSSNCRTPSGYTDYTSPSSTHASSCEDADSGDSHQASSLLHSVFESPQMGNGPLMDKKDVDLSLHPCTNNQDGQSSIRGTYYKPHFEKDQPHYSDDSGYVIDSQKTLGVGSWEEILEQCTTGYHTVTSHASMSSIQPTSTGFPLERQNLTPAEHLAGDRTLKQEFGSSLPIQENWQIPLEDNSQLPKCSPDQSMNLQLPCNLDAKLFEQRINDVNLRNAPELITNPNQRNEQLVQNNYQTQLTNAESQCLIVSNSEHDIPKDGNINYALTLRQQLLDREEGLKKVDSFSRWVSKELGEVDDLQMQSSSGISWSTVDCENVVNDSSLSPSISQDQLFSIVDFSPKWAYTDSEIEVRVIGAFLISQQDVVKYNWSCMFGEVEVPAEVIADGVLSCCAPPHGVGQVPFYVTCSNRLACSEVREFDYHDYQISSPKGLDMTDNSATDEMHLHLRLEKLLSLTSVSPPGQLFEGVKEKQNLISKIISLKEDEEYSHVPMPVNDLLQHDGMEHLIKMMKEKLYTWLLHKAIEDGKGPSVLDDEGQGVLHLAAALGYDWAIIPIETAGVSINFRDVNGWTALHWAAFYGREQTVAVLLSLGAAPGALTDPSPEYPLGRTPADLASVNRHKGISGFLAEASLTSYLDSLTMNDAKEDGAVEISGTRAVKTFSERTATPVNYADMPEALSLKDSLTAVTNATQAAVRIHQMFRMKSFERRKLTEYDDDDEFGMLDEQAISLIASKSRKAGSIKGLANTAAIQIQKKFRGWKKRKEFLQIRQRIVKIQAHVRGHQVRKQYKAITWSVGILEKVILRWRRKGTGLRGFRPDAVAKDPNPQVVPSEEDDYDFLKKGRKQTEERLQKALTRVKSMVQYPEGRAQYRRLLNVVEGFRETKASDSTMDGSEYKAEGGEDLIDIDKLLDDDTFMSIAFD